MDPVPDDPTDLAARPRARSDDLLSQREALALFVAMGIDRETARRVLRSGFVPPVHRTRGSTLYREHEVVAFLERQRTEPPPVGEDLVVVFRSHPRRPDPDSPVGWSGVDLTASAEEQLLAARAGGRGMSILTRAYVCLRAEDRPVPLLVTVGGFVALAAEVLGSLPPDEDERRQPAWRLRAAGSWAEAWVGLFVPTGPGGSSWRLLGPTSNPLVSRSGRRGGDGLGFRA